MEFANPIISKHLEVTFAQVNVVVHAMLAAVCDFEIDSLAAVRGADLLATEIVMVWVAIGGVGVEDRGAEGDNVVAIRLGQATGAGADVVPDECAGESGVTGVRGGGSREGKA